MPSGENSTADSMAKMNDVLSQRMLTESSRMSAANWKRAQRLAYGEACKEADTGAEEVILVDSTVTITNNGAPQATTSPEPQSRKESDQSSPIKTPAGRSAGTLAKIALGAALTASGAGAGIGIPLLMSGGNDVVKRAAEKAGSTPSASASKGWTLELGK